MKGNIYIYKSKKIFSISFNAQVLKSCVNFIYNHLVSKPCADATVCQRFRLCQPRKMLNRKGDIRLHVEFIDDISAPSGNTEGTICYIFLFSNRMFL